MALILKVNYFFWFYQLKYFSNQKSVSGPNPVICQAIILFITYTVYCHFPGFIDGNRHPGDMWWYDPSSRSG